MRILSIGNSFSNDAHRYLHSLAKYNGKNLTTVSLAIGGCTLRTHYLNMINDTATYSFVFNGESTEMKVSLREGLSALEWDVVTLQQASHLSANSETYFPYVEELAKYVKKYCPKAKILIHETWAYEEATERLFNVAKFRTSREMYESLRDAYAKAAEAIGADGIIPAGTAMINAYEMGIEKVHRDGFHARLGVGRYLLALCWFKYLTGKDISSDTFCDLDEEVTAEERAVAIAAVNSAIG